MGDESMLTKSSFIATMTFMVVFKCIFNMNTSLISLVTSFATGLFTLIISEKLSSSL